METNNNLPAVRGMTDKRAAFEQWFATVHADAPYANLFRRVVDDSRYESMEVEYAWLTWSRPEAPRPSVDLSGLTEKQIAAAGRALADRNADACGVDRDDNWKLYGDQYNEDAKVALTALLSALPAHQAAQNNKDTCVDVLLRELLGIAGSNRRGVGERVHDMRNLILMFQAKRAASASPAPAHQAVAAEGEKVPEAIRSAGAKMANTMFNLAQRAGDLIDGDLVASMDAMRKEWDAAIRAVPPVFAAEQPTTSADVQAKDHAVQQAQIWAQEARTQRATVLSILRYFGLPEHDWEALRLIQDHLARQAQAAVADHDEAVTLLSAVFDAWENGDPCYEDPDTCGGYLGMAFRLDDDVFNRCCALLNRLNPPRNAAPAQGSAPQARFPADLLPGAQSADDLRLRAASQAERAAVLTLWQKFLTASIAFAKAHIACDEHERTWGTDQEDQSEGAHEAYDQCTRRYNETKAELVGAYVLANAAAPVAQEADQMGGAQVDIGDSPDLRNIAEIVRPSDQSLHLRFMSTRSCSFFHRYIEEAREAQRNGSKAQTTLAASSESVDTPSEAEQRAAESKLYLDLTQDALRMGYDGIPAALEALRTSARATPAESVDTPELRELLHNYRKNPNFDTAKEYAALIAHITSLIEARVGGEIRKARVLWENDDKACLEKMARDLDAAKKERDELRAQVAGVRKDAERYNELIFAVGLKSPNESRHETALRYIRQAETPSGNTAMSASPASGSQETSHE